MHVSSQLLDKCKPALALLAAALVYYGLARLGLLLALEQSNASPIWPPSGFALALLLRFGTRLWPAILTGAFMANVAVFQSNAVASTSVILAASGAIAIGNTLEGAMAAVLLRRYRLQPDRLQTQPAVYRFAAITAGAALLAALIGSLALWASRIVPPGVIAQVCATWWIGDFLGMLIIAPLLYMLMNRAGYTRAALAALPRMAPLVLLTIAASLLVFLPSPDDWRVPRPLPYLLLGFIAWAAAGHRRGAVHLVLAIICGIAVPATATHHGAFVSGVLQHSLLSLCTFLGISALVAWVLAADAHSEAARAAGRAPFSWTPMLTLATGLALTVTAWSLVDIDTERRAQERFNVAADAVREKLAERLTTYESLLRAGAALFDASENVEQAEWHSYVSALDLARNYPGVLGMGYARFIPAATLENTLAVLRRGAPAFRVWPPGQRAAYVPVTYLEPESERNRAAIGYDMLTEPVRRQALNAAVQNGRLTASGPVTLVQEITSDRQVGFLMFNPVYMGAARTVQELAPPTGFVYSPFRMHDLMAGIFADSLKEVRVHIFDSSLSGKQMYASPAGGIGSGLAPSYLPLASIKYVTLGDNGHQWALRITPTAAFDGAIDQAKSHIVLALGTLISLLFYAVSRTLVKERQLAQVNASRSTASLELSEARFQLLTANIKNHAIVLLDTDGHIATWNAGAMRLFGYPDEQIIGQPMAVLGGPAFGTGQSTRASLETALQLGQYEELGERTRLDGTAFLALMQIFPARGKDGECIGYAMILRDVTHEKAAERELNEARLQAEAASAAKSLFVANMSHELRTPMNAVLGAAQLLVKTPLNTEQNQFVQMISVAGKSLLAVLNDVLDFSKIEADKLEVNNEDFYLEDVTEALASVLAINAGEKGLAVAICVASDVPDSLCGDAQRLQQVLLNLLSNAVKFSERGSVCLRIFLVAGQSGQGSQGDQDALNGQPWLRFEVADTGIGIPADQIERLFIPFNQADSSMARKFGGTGLGLALSRRFVTMMGGVIDVRSTPGMGSVFGVQLPLRRGTQPAHGNLPPGGPGMRPLRILCITPDSHAQQCVAQLGARWQAVTQAARSTDEACLLYDAAQANGAPFCAVLYERNCRLAMAQLRSAGGFGADGQPPEGGPPVLIEMAHMFEVEPSSAGCWRPHVVLTHPLTRRNLQAALSAPTGRAAEGAAAITATGVVGATAAPDGFRSDAAARPLALAGLRILLAEDNALNQMVAQSMLEHAGATVAIAANGAEAVAYLGQHGTAVDIVIMDVQMPVMDGFEATRRIRNELGLQLPVLAMSAGVTLTEQVQCQAAGMDDFIAKPVEWDDMVAVLLRHATRTAQS